MSAITPRQRYLLNFIADYHANKQASPSFDEMREACRLKSKSGVHRMITALEERGYIRRIVNRARAIEVVDQPKLPTSLSCFDVSDLAREAKRRGLVLGQIKTEPYRHESGDIRVARKFIEVEA
jgi:repressor LexA